MNGKRSLDSLSVFRETLSTSLLSGFRSLFLLTWRRLIGDSVVLFKRKSLNWEGILEYRLLHGVVMDQFTVCAVPMEDIPFFPAHRLDNGQLLQFTAFRYLTCCDASYCYRRKPAEQQCLLTKELACVTSLSEACCHIFSLCEDLQHISDSSTVSLVTLRAFKRHQVYLFIGGFI